MLAIQFLVLPFAFLCRLPTLNLAQPMTLSVAGRKGFLGAASPFLSRLSQIYDFSHDRAMMTPSIAGSKQRERGSRCTPKRRYFRRGDLVCQDKAVVGNPIALQAL